MSVGIGGCLEEFFVRSVKATLFLQLQGLSLHPEGVQGTFSVHFSAY